jgi:hypothetical protein
MGAKEVNEPGLPLVFGINQQENQWSLSFKGLCLDVGTIAKTFD